MIPKLNELVKAAAAAQEAFDNWDEGKTWPDISKPWHATPRFCTLATVVRELDEANLKLVDYVLQCGSRLHDKLKREEAHGR